MLDQAPLEQEEESVEDLLASIRDLVYPNSMKEAKDSDSSSKTQVRETLSSFARVVQEKPHAVFQKTVESFLADLLKGPLQDILKEGQPLIFGLAEKYIHDHLPTLLMQWMDSHLPGLVKECVNRYLESLQHRD